MTKTTLVILHTLPQIVLTLMGLWQFWLFYKKGGLLFIIAGCLCLLTVVIELWGLRFLVWLRNRRKRQWVGWVTWRHHDRQDYMVIARSREEAARKIIAEAEFFAPDPLLQEVRPKWGGES